MVDLKQRVFGTPLREAKAPIRPTFHDDGFYCGGREYIEKPHAGMFEGYRRGNYYGFVNARGVWSSSDEATVKKIVAAF